MGLDGLEILASAHDGSGADPSLTLTFEISLDAGIDLLQRLLRAPSPMPVPCVAAASAPPQAMSSELPTVVGRSLPLGEGPTDELRQLLQVLQQSQSQARRTTREHLGR